MRLVCPNCAAQYEVDANAIPEDGRDVQCANCGNTWFQDRGEPGQAATHEQPDHTGDDAGPDTYDANGGEDAQDDDETAPDEDQRQTHIRPQAAPVDQSVLDILRQEADLDASTRQAGEASHAAPDEPEAEPDDASDDTPDDPADEDDGLALRARAARSRLTSNPERERRLHLSPETDEDQFDDDLPEDVVSVAPAPQRRAAAEHPQHELPDVDALNSSLRSADDDSRVDDERARRRKPAPGKRSNSLGFYLAVLIFLILLALYALKPQIIAALPGAAPYLDQYTLLVDAARHRLAEGMLALIEAARNLMAQYL